MDQEKIVNIQSRRKKITTLKIILRLLSVLLMFALFAVFLPVETMGRIHLLLGLGEMPISPIVEYLARSVSLFYALQGFILWYISSKPEVYLKFLKFYLWISYPFAIGLFFIDLNAGMPLYWIGGEAPLALVLITLLLLLVKRIESSKQNS
jgi:hypothetical protein